MDDAVEQYFSQGLSRSSQKVYAAGIKRFRDFCLRLKITPVPSTELILCRFVAMLAKDNIAYNSIKVYLAVIRQFLLREEQVPPNTGAMACLQQVLRGIKIAQSITRQPFQRKPNSPDLLRDIKRAWEQMGLSQDRTMLWAAFFCVFGFMKSGELCTQKANNSEEAVELAHHNVAVDNLANPTEIQVCLKKSKTDMFRQGTLIHVGRTDDNLCSVAALLSWMVTRGNKPGSLFHFASGKLLSHSTFVMEFRQALSEAGVSPNGYSGYSFRSGAATTAARNGVLDCHIKKLGRWKSSAYLWYIKPAPSQLAPFSRTLVTSSSGESNNHSWDMQRLNTRAVQ